MRRQSGGLAVVLTVIAAFAGGFVAQSLMGGRTARAQEAAAPTVMKAGAFVVVDAQGRERGRLAVQDDGVGLTLSDAEGRRRLALGSPSVADPERVRWVLSLYDRKGTYRVLLAAREDGEGNSGQEIHGRLRPGVLGALGSGSGVPLCRPGVLQWAAWAPGTG